MRLHSNLISKEESGRAVSLTCAILLAAAAKQIKGFRCQQFIEAFYCFVGITMALNSFLYQHFVPDEEIKQDLYELVVL